MANKIWLLDHPLNQYKENVKKIARIEQVSIVNSRFKDQFRKEELFEYNKKLTILPSQAEELRLKAKQAKVDKELEEFKVFATAKAEIEAEAKIKAELKFKAELDPEGKGKTEK